MALPTESDGLEEIRGVQVDMNKKIAKAPVKGGWNPMTNSKTESKYELERAKFNAVKAIIQDYAVFQIHLLDDEVLERMKPKTESTSDRYMKELRE